MKHATNHIQQRYAIAGTDASLLSVNAITGNVTLTANPDYETKPSYSFTVTASDDAGTSNATNVTSSITNLNEVGDLFQGGIIYYLLQDEDLGYDPIVQHGLIAATADQSTGIQWYNGTWMDTGATGTEVGTGTSNTDTIISSQGSGSYAAQVCADYSVSGYSDWYLPSKDELNLLYVERATVGGITGDVYWSSTENNTNWAWLQFFSSGSQDGNSSKSYTRYVRAVRAF